MDDIPDKSKAPHPDAIIRLVSAVHRFRCPEMSGGTDNLSFARSFKTSGGHPIAQAGTAKTDTARASLYEALVSSERSSTPSYQSIRNAATAYVPLIHQILLTCKVQPEVARLDQRLVFEWSSGIEKIRKFFKSEALMFELVMSVACEGMGTAGVACDDCIAGDFAAAGRGFKAAAGIMRFLADDQLPKWISRGASVEDADMPGESTVGVCDAFALYFLGVGQQMAVATVLIKPGVPNYSLVAKLCLGIAEEMEQFIAVMRSKAQLAMTRIDPGFFVLIAFETALQKALCMYFFSRSLWDKGEYGLAICMLKESMASLKTRVSPTGKGLPEFPKKSPLATLNKDITDLRTHCAKLLQAWDNDNNKVYFDRVPETVPHNKLLTKGLMMMKPDPYVIEELDPLPLGYHANVDGGHGSGNGGSAFPDLLRGAVQGVFKR